jgi:hypothetical protein
VDYCRVDAELLCCSTGDVLHGVSTGKGAAAEEERNRGGQCAPVRLELLTTLIEATSTGLAQFAAGTDHGGGMPVDTGLGGNSFRRLSRRRARTSRASQLQHVRRSWRDTVSFPKSKVSPSGRAPL